MPVRLIALLIGDDMHGLDEIVICVAADEAAWVGVRSREDLPPTLREAIERFATRPRLTGEAASTLRWLSADHGATAIDAAAARWAATTNGRG